MALILLLKSWVVAPFAWAKKLWIKITDLGWMVAPFAWMWACVKRALLWVWRLSEEVKIGKPRFLESEVWKMEWFKRPEWLSWGGWEMSVPEVVKDGFEVFVPDGAQVVEDVTEEF